MRRAVPVALGATAVALVALLGLGLHTWFGQPLRIDWFFARVHLQDLRADPEALSLQGGWLARWERADRRLTDLSPEAQAAAQRRALAQRDTLSGYDCAVFDGERRQSCEVLGYQLDRQIEAQRWRHYDHPVNPLFGLQNTLPATLLGAVPLDSPAAIDALVARLHAVPWKIDGLLREYDQRAAAGILPPRSMVRRVLVDLRGFVAPAPADNVLIRGLDERLQAVPAARLPDELRARLRGRAIDAVADSVYPAWLRLIAHFEALQTRPLNDEGAWSKPDGDAYYAFIARWHTTTGLTPSAIHQLGLAEVQRLERELDGELAAVGLADGSVGERLRQLGRRDDQRYSAASASADDVLAAFRQMVDAARTASAVAFDPLPAAGLQVEAVPARWQRSAPGAYYSPPMIDGQEGTVYLNLRDLDDLPRFSLRSLAHHEAIPGHHLQSAWLQQQHQLPAFRAQLTFSAYAEGWAMYAEQLADELGLLPTAEDRIGRLQAEIFRAARLVVDTGIHQQRWKLAHAEHYLREHAGLGEADARAEVERYLVYPGQALCFHIGLQRFRALRSRAEAALGARFDLPSFHRVLLDGGRLPLDLLDLRVQRWIDRHDGKAEDRE